MQIILSAIGFLFTLFVGSYHIERKQYGVAVFIMGVGLPFAIEIGLRMSSWK